FTQGAATGLVGGERREMIVGGPAHELGPFDRFELTVWEFQRAFSKCGGRHETCDRADETCNEETCHGHTCNRARAQGLPPPATSLHANTCAGSRSRHPAVVEPFSRWLLGDVRACSP